jgi:hypothetical protein
MRQGKLHCARLPLAQTAERLLRATAARADGRAKLFSRRGATRSSCGKGVFSEPQFQAKPKIEIVSGGGSARTRQRERRSSRGRHCVKAARAVAMAAVDANQPGSLCALLHSPSPDASGADTMPARTS